MKNYLTFFAAVAAVAFAFSCNKAENASEPSPVADEITFEFNIPSLGGAGTKVAKTDWAEGDKLNLWFDGNGADVLEPDLVLTYTSGTWKAGKLREGVQDGLKSSGVLLYLYEGFNDLTSSEYYTTKSLYMNRQWYYPKYVSPEVARKPDSYSASHDVYFNSMAVSARQQEYTFDGSKVTSSVDSWSFKTPLRILVLNDDNKLVDGKDYYLQLLIDDNPVQSLGALTIALDSNGNTVGGGSSNYTGFSGGVKEEGGLAFYYSSFSDISDTQSIVFNIYEGDDADSKRTYTVTGKTVSYNSEVCFSVAIDNSSLKAAE